MQKPGIFVFRNCLMQGPSVSVIIGSIRGIIYKDVFENWTYWGSCISECSTIRLLLVIIRLLFW